MRLAIYLWVSKLSQAKISLVSVHITQKDCAVTFGTSYDALYLTVEFIDISHGWE